MKYPHEGIKDELNRQTLREAASVLVQYIEEISTVGVLLREGRGERG